MGPRTVPRRLGALAVAGTLALAGCGASGDDEPAAETTTTEAAAPSTSGAGSEAGGDAKADFVAQANQICREAIEELSGQEPSGSDEDEIVAYITGVFVPSVRQQLDDIRDLGFPPGDEAELTELLDAADAALDEIEADAAGVLASGEDPFAEVNDQLNAYGLTECGGD
jgi:hypothetical protein